MSIQIISRAIKTVNPCNILLKHYTLLPVCGCHQNFYAAKSTNVLTGEEIDSITGERPSEKKKTKIIPKITLISGDQLTVTSLDEAQRLSKRRDLKLVKIVDLDTKTQRPTYKLMTGSEYLAEDLKQRELKKKEKQASTIKGEKLLILNHNISEHDLTIDVKKINKWISKSYEVRIVINGEINNMGKAEKVYNFLENSLKAEARFLQRRQKGSDIKFQIMPPKKNKSDDNKGL